MLKMWVHKIEGTPIGTIWIAGSEQGMARLEIGMGADEFLHLIRSPSAMEDSAESLEPARQVMEYLAGQRRGFSLPVDWSGMAPFQQQVLRLVAEIPYGQTSTYGAIANQLGKPGAARAVGRANATNPISLILPCHRVVGADGSLRGYGGGHGVATKRWLLDLEQGKI